MKVGTQMHCPVCGSGIWGTDLVAGRILGLPDGYNVLVCKTCGQRRLNPQLSDSDLADLYSGAYFDAEQTLWKPSSAIVALASSDINSNVFQERRAKFKQTIEQLRDLLPSAITILDVGAATGEFVKIARDGGFQADGVEFSEFAIKKAKEVYQIDLQQLALQDINKDEYYDIVHLNHVFEHFNEPLTELRQLHRLMKVGGVLYIEIPFQFHFVEKTLFRLRNNVAVFNLSSLHHPYFYTPRTIVRLLRAHGFDIVKVTVFDRRRDRATGLQGTLKKFVWWALSKVKVGNHIEVFAKRRV